jgi:DNA-binding NarL/FixJ family response regulator
MTICVLVADDQAPFRRAVRAILCATVDFELVGEAASGEEAVQLADTLRPELVLMDVSMAGIGGIEAARSITSAHPETLTVLVSTYREEDLPRDALVCGASAYVPKSELTEDVLRELWGARRADGSSGPRRGT